MDAPAPVGPVGTLFTRLREAADGGAVALGVDFPLGLPRAYAAIPGAVGAAADFPAFFAALAERPDFFAVSAELASVCAARPFYPARGVRGMTRAAHAAAIGLPDAAALCRACDRATDRRPAGAPLFWTLGANQSGKAAISAWRDLLLPALAEGDAVRLWPFAGPFRALLAPGAVAVAETYPAEALRQLDLRLRGSKRRHADRIAFTPALLGALASLGAVGTDTFLDAARTGFGADAAGEDRMDSVLGLLCVLSVLDGRRPDTPPPDPALIQWEGFVLGQTDLPRVATAPAPTARR